MALDSLLNLIEELRGRIGQHSAVLRQNEMATRYILIDPLLRELGWDTENPEQVIPEYRSGSGSADYVLLQDGKPIVVVEAKKLDTSLNDGLIQAINYCITDGTPYFAVTDGRRWEVYETHRPVPIAEKLLTRFDFVAEPASTSALKVLILWQPGVGLGLKQIGEEPLVGRANEASTTRDLPPIAPPEIRQEPTPQPNSDSPWEDLSKIQPVKFGPAPQTLRLPDGAEKALGKWVNLPLEVVNWLWGNGILTAENCPIKSAGRYLVNTTPAHPGGRPFKNAKQVGQLFLEANYSGPDQHRNTVTILKHLGQSPSDFVVKF